MDRPIYYIYAGVNGAGKSSLYDIKFIKSDTVNRVNADEILQRNGGDWRNVGDFAIASKEAIITINYSFKNKISICQETTLTGRSILKNINKAIALGYQIKMYYIGLNSPGIAMERVQERVSKGGHGIPEADIERRYYESLHNFNNIISLIDYIYLYDNSSTSPIQLIQIVKGNILLSDEVSQLPQWIKELHQISNSLL